MVVVDWFSKGCKLIPLKGLPTAMQSAEAMFNHVFRNFGLPEDIVSDRGRQFTSRVWGSLCARLAIGVSLSSGYHPQSNGQAERLSQEIGRFLRTYCSREQHRWTAAVPWSGEPSDVPAVEEWYRLSQEVWERAHVRLQRAVRRQRIQADRRRHPHPSYQVGQKVWLSTRNLRLKLPYRKLTPKFVSPFEIVRQPAHPAAGESRACEEPPPPLDIEGSPAYQVRALLNSRRVRSRLQYLMDWEGYSPEERSWVDAADILDPSLIEDFHRDHPNKLALRPRGRRRRRTPGGVPRGGDSVTTRSRETQNQFSGLPAITQMNKKMEAKCFRDIRDVVFGLSDEDWRAVSRDLSYKYTRLELAIVCSSLVKILSSLLIECVLPLLIDAVGIEAVLRTEIKLREKHTERGSRTRGPPEDPSDYISSFIQGLVSQIKEAMKQALMKFSSKPATAGETSSEHPLIDDLSASSTKAIITEIIRLCYPDIYYKTMKGKKPESFQQVINSIAKAMEHIQKVHRFSSMSDALGESDIEKGTMSDGGDENVFSEHVRTKAAHVISSILHEASEEVASAGSTHSDSASLDEITVLASSVRVHPTASKITKTLLKGLKKQPSSDEMSTLMFSRKKFFPAACETTAVCRRKCFDSF
ncbi:hypothetical protein QTP70_013746 [Hemibagrus guttatus]|uniref:Uncharacterized protein n=1 Tax=Hemibagrus guttatus TaxID=175788 RepID=A0AAE0UKK9_9TELE|nr:hypothetical protein QTP70_013746 [Hemibagrus guttatus]